MIFGAMSTPRSSPPPLHWGELIASRLTTRRPFPQGPLLSELAEVARILDAAHARGAVHGGFDPTSVIVGGGAERKVVRGGHPFPAPAPTEDTPSPEPRYVAPEVRSGHPATPASDRFGLAVFAFESLTLWRVDALDEPRPSLVDPQLERLDGIFARALSPLPQDRFPSSRAFVSALKAVLGSGRSVGRARGALASIAVVLTFAGGWWVGRMRAPEGREAPVPLSTETPASAQTAREVGGTAESILTSASEVASMKTAPSPRIIAAPTAQAAARAPLPSSPPPTTAKAPAAARRGRRSAERARRAPSAGPAAAPDGQSSELDARMAALAQDPNDLEGFRRAHAAFRAAARRLPPSASAEVEVRLRNLAFLADGPGLLELWREYGGRLR